MKKIVLASLMLFAATCMLSSCAKEKFEPITKSKNHNGNNGSSAHTSQSSGG